MRPTRGPQRALQKFIVSALWLTVGQLLAHADSTPRTSSLCPPIQIRVTGAVAAEWLAELSGACAEIADLPDIDRTATVIISPAAKGVQVQVALSDGRSVTRTVKAPALLVSTLEALLSVPAVARRAPAMAASAAGGHLDHEVPGFKEHQREEDRRARKLGLEVGGNLGIRAVGNRPFWAGSSAVHAELRKRSWLMGVSARWDVVIPKLVSTPADFEMDAFSIGATVARRFAVSGGQVDIGIAPRLAFDEEKAEVVTGEADGGRWDVRFGAFGRVRLGSTETPLRLELDAEVSPRYLRQAIRIDPELPRLPGWTAGVAIGVSWATP